MIITAWLWLESNGCGSSSDYEGISVAVITAMIIIAEGLVLVFKDTTYISIGINDVQV